MVKISEALSSQKKKADVDMDVAETCNIIDYKEYHKNTHHEGGNEGNESDDENGEEGRGGTRVRCNQQ